MGDGERNTDTLWKVHEYIHVQNLASAPCRPYPAAAVRSEPANWGPRMEPPAVRSLDLSNRESLLPRILSLIRNEPVSRAVSCTKIWDLGGV